MNAEENDFRPGFLGDRFDGQEVPRPPGGWQALDEALHGHERRRWVLLLLGTLLLGTAGSIGWLGFSRLDGTALESTDPVAVTAPAQPKAATAPAAAGQDIAQTTPNAGLAPDAGTAAQPRTGATDNRFDHAQQKPLLTADDRQGNLLPASGLKADHDARTNARGTEPATEPIVVVGVPTKPSAKPRSGEGDATGEPSATASPAVAGTAGIVETQPAVALTRRRDQERFRRPAGGTIATTASAARLGRKGVANTDEPVAGQPTSAEERPAVADNAGKRTDNPEAEMGFAPVEVPGAEERLTLDLEAAETQAASLTLPVIAKEAMRPVEIAKALRARMPVWMYETGLRVIVRERDASLLQSAEGTRLSWDNPPPAVTPGLELYGSVARKLGKTVVVGGTLGLGGWQDRLAYTAEAPTPGASTLMNTNTVGEYALGLNYDGRQSYKPSWMTAQVHTELWVRLAPASVPLQVQAGPMLSLVSVLNPSDNTPRGTRFAPGLAAAVRLAPGRHFCYEVELRRFLNPASYEVPGVYRFRYQQLVTVGVGYTW